MSQAETLRVVAEIATGGKRPAFPQVRRRSIHQYWPRLAPYFHPILLAPRRRPDDRAVCWAWRQPSTAPAPNPGELVEVRHRLTSAQAALVRDLADSAESSREDLPPELLTVMQAIVQRLVTRSDSQLAGFTGRTETALMIHSWGAAQPARVFFPDEAGAEASGTLLAGETPAAGYDVVIENRQGRRLARTKSDGAGRFRFGGIAPGSYRLRVDSDQLDFPVHGLDLIVEHQAISGLELRSRSLPVAPDPGPAGAEPSPLLIAASSSPATPSSAHLHRPATPRPNPRRRARFVGAVVLILITAGGIAEWRHWPGCIPSEQSFPRELAEDWRSQPPVVMTAGPESSPGIRRTTIRTSAATASSAPGATSVPASPIARPTAQPFDAAPSGKAAPPPKSRNDRKSIPAVPGPTEADGPPLPRAVPAPNGGKQARTSGLNVPSVAPPSIPDTPPETHAGEPRSGGPSAGFASPSPRGASPEPAPDPPAAESPVGPRTARSVAPAGRGPHAGTAAVAGGTATSATPRAPKQTGAVPSAPPRSSAPGAGVTALRSDAAAVAGAAPQKKGSPPRPATSARVAGQECPALPSGIALRPAPLAPPLGAGVTVHPPSWMVRLVRDEILPTSFQIVGEQDKVSSLRARILQQRRAQLPATIRRRSIHHGVRLELSADNATTRVPARWQCPAEAESAAAVDPHGAWLTLPSEEPRSPLSYTLLDATGRALVQLILHDRAELWLADPAGVACWYWIRADYDPSDVPSATEPTGPSRFVWRMAPDLPLPPTWRKIDRPDGTPAGQLELPLRAERATGATLALAWVDRISGWAVTGEVRITPASGPPPPQP